MYKPYRGLFSVYINTQPRIPRSNLVHLFLHGIKLLFSCPSLLHPPGCLLALPTFLPVTEKLTRTNHQSWKAQVLSAIHGAQLADWLEANAEPPAKFLDKIKPE
jgi:hypothetical protein